jgi:hypothetical protein
MLITTLLPLAHAPQGNSTMRHQNAGVLSHTHAARTRPTAAAAAQHCYLLLLVLLLLLLLLHHCKESCSDSELLCDGQLSARERAQVAHHEQVLQVAVEHLSEDLWPHAGHNCQSVCNAAAYFRVCWRVTCHNCIYKARGLPQQLQQPGHARLQRGHLRVHCCSSCVVFQCVHARN